jgi:2-polyprenyl-3-methyl-5-hydroxy-6-metoxy-1,4-benzoquinol methylase
MPHHAPATLPGYLTKTETLHRLGADLRVRSLLDRQQFHDPLGEAERAGICEAQWPLFGLVWSSGLVLADSMLTYELAGKRILELGCGLALASQVVHRRGGDITASDRHPLAQAFLLENLKLNALGAVRYETGDWACTTDLLGKFDLIIGSDVLYDRDMPGVLSGFIDRHSCDVVEVLIVDPNRGNRASFTRSMDGLGYSHSRVSLSALPNGGGPYKGRVLSYRRDSRPE